MRNRKGFTLAEIMVSTTILLIVMGTVYAIIISTQRAHLSEGRKLDMHQAARVTQQMLSDSLKGAGAVLSMAHTPSFVGTAVVFNGIYPLNNTNFPDGIILAQGDGRGVTRLTASFNPGQTQVNITSANDPTENNRVAWREGDYGIIYQTNGYYIFRVTQTPALGDTILLVREQPVYFSGLLNTVHYNDFTDEQTGFYGNSFTYDINSPVIRLEFFQIYLVRQDNQGNRTLTLTTDCEGVADVLNAAPTPYRNIPILPNIQDLQIEFISKDNPPQLWAGTDITFNQDYPNPCGSGPITNDCRSFYNQFLNRNLFSARVSLLAQTELETEKPGGTIYRKPAMGDAPSLTLPVIKTHYRLYQFEVLMRNYSTVY